MEQCMLMCRLCDCRCRGAPTTTTTAMYSSSYRWQTGPMWTPSGLDGMPLTLTLLLTPHCRACALRYQVICSYSM